MNHIVLYEPEIPQNTGNIMRTALATNFKVHLIEPLGFKLDSRSIKRSGANHIKYVDYKVYKNWDEFISKNKGKFFFFTRYAHKGFYDIKVENKDEDYYFVFGKESTGINHDILRANFDFCIRLPMNSLVRSLNLSNTVAVICYEVLRQQGFNELSIYEPETFKGKDFLFTEKLIK
ncbi:MAG: tRNA (cytidine(34)-2'-O)-methyltransferase [Bacilli bacterium]|nr:tRNA (cytidine(34)-2'-O)-methyltransferase [Bacilli bacterium]